MAEASGIVGWKKQAGQKVTIFQQTLQISNKGDYGCSKFQFCPQIFTEWGFSAPNFAFLDVRRDFPTAQKLWGLPHASVSISERGDYGGSEFQFCPKIFEEWGFQPKNFAFLDENFPTRRFPHNFPTAQKLWGGQSPPPIPPSTTPLEEA